MNENLKIFLLIAGALVYLALAIWFLEHLGL